MTHREHFGDCLPVDGQGQGPAHPLIPPNFQIHVEVVKVGTHQGEHVELGILGDQPGNFRGRHRNEKIELTGLVGRVGGGLIVDELHIQTIEFNIPGVPVMGVLREREAVADGVGIQGEGAVAHR